MESIEPKTDVLNSCSGAGHIRVEFLDRFSQANTSSFPASLLLSLLVVLGLWSHLPHESLLAWLFTVWLVQSAHEVYSRYYRKHRDSDAADYGRWLRGFWLAAAAVGVCWSIPFFLIDAVSSDAVLLLVFAIAGVTAYGGVARSSVLSVALVFETATLLPICIWLFQQDSGIHRIMGVASLLYLAMLTPLLRKMNRMVTRTFYLDGENRRLNHEQKIYLERLRRSEEEFRTLAENMPDNVVRWDKEGRYTYINPALERTLGKKLGELVGKRPSEVFPDRVIEQMEAAVLRLISDGGGTVLVPQSVYAEGGQTAFHEVKLVTEKNDAGEVIGVLGIGRDMTVIKRAETELANERATLRAFFGALPALAWMKDTEGRYLACNSSFEQFVGMTEAEILGKTDFDFVEESLAKRFRQDDSRAIASGKPCVTEEWATFACDTRRVLLETVKAPVADAGGRVIGIIGMAHDITERKHSEKVLQERGDLLHAIMESSPEIIVFALDAQYRYLSFNARHRQVMQTIWGKDIDVGISMLDVIGDHADREVAKRGFDRALAGESFVDESAYGDQALSREYWQTFWSPIRTGAGEVRGLTCFVLNVSERRRAEESLRRSEQLMRTVIDATPDWIFVKDRYHRYQLVNKSYADALNIPFDDFIDKDHLELAFREERVKGNPTQDICGFWADDQVVLDSNTALVKPEHAIAMDGEVRTFHVTKVPLRDDETMPWGVLAFVRDITEHKQAQTMLQERYDRIVDLHRRLEEDARLLEEQAVELEASKEQLMRTEAWYRGILQSAPDGMVVVDGQGSIRLVNAQLCRIFGYDDGELIGQPIELLVPLDTRGSHEALRSGFIASGAPGRPMGGGASSLRGRRKDGSEFFVDVCLSRLPKMDDAVGTVCAAIRDVTERRRMEETLAKREQEFRTLVENSVDRVARYGRDLRRLYVNPAFAALVTGGADALIGRTPTECPGGANALTYENKLAQVFAEGRGTEFESKWTDRAGREMCSLISLTPEFDARGEVSSVLSVGRDITELNAFRHKIHQMAFYDPLTSLPNRALFNDRLRQMIADAAWHGQQAGLMMMDMDRFKAVNDTLGHPAGDELLRETAARLSTCVRAYDTVARLGGDEFAILLPEVRSGDDLGRIASKVLAVFQRPFQLSGKEVFISCSIGIALYPGDSIEADDLLKYADSAMYFAKRSGRNNFRFYSRDLTESSHERLVLESDLRRALERDELELYYQPKVNLSDGELTGSEALLRWRHPERGMVPPNAFIGIAEDSGLIVEIGEWVLREACRTASRWNGEGRPLHKVAINLSPRQFQGADLGGMVFRALEESACRPEWIELEITESLLLDEENEVLEVLNSFRAKGITIAIDDFGTGYSALSYLARFPIGTLKIDRSFISSIATDTYRAELVKAILSIARCLGQQVVAEGVETPEQAAFLKAHGCHVAQGYLYGKPMRAQEFERVSNAKLSILAEM